MELDLAAPDSLTPRHHRCGSETIPLPAPEVWATPIWRFDGTRQAAVHWQLSTIEADRSGCCNLITGTEILTPYPVGPSQRSVCRLISAPRMAGELHYLSPGPAREFVAGS